MISVDNFQPYIQKVEVLIDNINVYTSGWECNNNCPTFTGYECIPTQVSGSSVIKVLVTSSEALLQLSGKIVELNGGFVQFTPIGNDKKQWQAVFYNMGHLQDGDKGHLQFQGLDLNDNFLLDMRTIVGGQVFGNICANIPIRANASQWIPSRVGGYTDDVHEFCFTTCRPRLSGNQNGCVKSEDISVKTQGESSINRKDGWIKLTISNHTLYWVRWLDEFGNTIKYGFKENVLTGLGSGKFCYEVNDDECCFVNNCVYLCSEIEVNCIVNTWDPTDCDSDNGGFRVVNTSSSGGTPPYSYHVEDANGNIIPHSVPFFVVNNLKSGNYYIVSKDAKGCTGKQKVELLSPDGFGVNLVSIQHTCPGRNLGRISIYSTSSDPNETYNYNWSNGVSHMNIPELEESILENLTSGTYCVTVTSNSTSCEYIDCYHIKDNSGSPLMMSTNLQMPCKNQRNGKLNLKVTGGTLPYTYNWDPPGTQPYFGLYAGTYCVTVTDFCGSSIHECFELKDVEYELKYGIPVKTRVGEKSYPQTLHCQFLLHGLLMEVEP